MTHSEHDGVTVRAIVVGPLEVNCYLVWDSTSPEALVVDAGAEVPRILKELDFLGVSIGALVSTHGHPDHIAGNRALKEATGCPILMHAADAPMAMTLVDPAFFSALGGEPSPRPDRLLADGDVVRCGKVQLSVIHTPGHSPGGICLSGHGLLFSGDTLFAGSIGRTDLPGSSTDALLESIHSRLTVLPEATIVLPGHGPRTTLGREKRHNPFLSASVP